LKPKQLELQHAMQLAVLDQKLKYEEDSTSDMTLVQLEMRMKSWLSDEFSAIGFEDMGLIIAFCLYRKDESQILIRKLYVLEDERRKGLASALLNSLIAQTNQPLQLYNAPSNPIARSLFNKLNA